MTTPYLGNPKYTIEVLQKYGFVFQKRFGQNFLLSLIKIFLVKYQVSILIYFFLGDQFTKTSS